MLPRAYISHQIENRIRFYLPQEKGNLTFFSEIEKKLLKCDGVVQVQANPITGSILILYEGDLSTVIQEAKKVSLFKLEPAIQGPTKWTEDVLEKLEKVDKEIIVASNSNFSLVSLAALGLFGAGVFQLSRRQFFPAASSLFTDACRILMQSNRGLKSKSTPRSKEWAA
jgi:hypothetical protein